MRIYVLVASLLVAGPALAQESAHYKLESGTFNAGGRPSQGVVAQSASYLLSLDAIGDAAIGMDLIGTGPTPAYSMSGGLAGTIRPPAEVRNLRFTDSTTLWWDPDAATGDYALYQGTVGSPFPAGYGSCFQPPPAIMANTTTVASVPATGKALFYLVTARNRVAEEGTKGFSSAGVQHPNPAPCSYVASSQSTFPVDSQPYGVVSQGSSIWVTIYGSNYVTKLRASDGVVLGNFTVGDNPREAAFDGSNIWVVNTSSNNVTKLRASDGTVLGTYPVGSGPNGIVFDGSSVWVTNVASNDVTKLRASDGANLGTFPVGSLPYGVVFDGSSIWVPNFGSHSVTKLRASDGAVLGTIPVGSLPYGVVFDGSSIWVTNYGGDNVMKLRASDGANLGTFSVGGGPTGMAFDGSSIWVANTSSDNMTKLRASDGANLGTFSVGNLPIVVAFDGSSIWVVNYGSGTVSKL